MPARRTRLYLGPWPGPEPPAGKAKKGSRLYRILQQVPRPSFKTDRTVLEGIDETDPLTAYRELRKMAKEVRNYGRTRPYHKEEECKNPLCLWHPESKSPKQLRKSKKRKGHT